MNISIICSGPIPDDADSIKILYKGWWLWKKPYAVSYKVPQIPGQEFEVPYSCIKEYWYRIRDQSDKLRYEINKRSVLIQTLILGNCYMEPHAKYLMANGYKEIHYPNLSMYTLIPLLHGGYRLDHKDAV